MSYDRIKMGVLSVALLFVMGCLDYVTGYELVFSAAYLLPVSVCAWCFGRTSVLLMSLAAGIATWTVDAIQGHSYSHFMFQYWNSFTCSLISVVVGLVLHRLRITLAAQRRTNDDLKSALAQVERSTREIRELQKSLQVVCAWTNRIKVGDQWMTPDDFLSKHLHLNLTHAISPEAVHQMRKDLKKEAAGSSARDLSKFGLPEPA